MSSPQQYLLKEAYSRAELDAIVDVMWAAHYNPYRATFQTFFPILGPTAEDMERAIAECKDRLWEQHRNQHQHQHQHQHRDGGGHWLYVLDRLTSEVVGGTHWQLQQPSVEHAGPIQLEATWWPPGEAREFAAAVIGQVYAPRHRFLSGAYLGKISLQFYHNFLFLLV